LSKIDWCAVKNLGITRDQHVHGNHSGGLYADNFVLVCVVGQPNGWLRVDHDTSKLDGLDIAAVVVHSVRRVSVQVLGRLDWVRVFIGKIKHWRSFCKLLGGQPQVVHAVWIEKKIIGVNGSVIPFRVRRTAVARLERLECSAQRGFILHPQRIFCHHHGHRACYSLAVHGAARIPCCAALLIYGAAASYPRRDRAARTKSRASGNHTAIDATCDTTITATAAFLWRLQWSASVAPNPHAATAAPTSTWPHSISCVCPATRDA